MKEVDDPTSDIDMPQRELAVHDALCIASHVCFWAFIAPLHRAFAGSGSPGLASFISVAGSTTTATMFILQPGQGPMTEWGRLRMLSFRGIAEHFGAQQSCLVTSHTGLGCGPLHDETHIMLPMLDRSAQAQTSILTLGGGPPSLTSRGKATSGTRTSSLILFD